jgi:hypothetical protein
MSIHSHEVQLRIAALMAVARDGRRTRQVREAAVSELKELKGQRQQGQQAERTVTAVSPSVPAQPYNSRSVPPVSILNDPRPSDDAEDAEDTDTARPPHIQDERARLLEYLERARSIGDEERIQYAEERLAELEELAAPARETSEIKPAEKSDWQKLHEYFYSEPVQPAPQQVKVDFAGFGIPEQGSTDWYWDKQWTRESTARALAAKRTGGAGPQVKFWRPGLEFDEL